MDDAMIDQLFNEITSGLIDLDEYLVSLTHIISNMGVNEEHLSKVWRISLETVSKILNTPSLQQRRCISQPG
eukprot:4934312-Ditylum_brightwellii.AAC.1